MRPELAAGIAALFLLVASTAASAHTRSHSYSYWALDGQPIEVTLRIHEADLARLGLRPPLTPAALSARGARLTGRLRLRTPAASCRPGPVGIGAGVEGWQVLRWTLACVESGPYSIGHDLLREEAAHHLHFARVRLPDGSLHDQALGTGHRSWTPLAATDFSSTQTGFTQWLGLGIEHLVGGWDHVAFVLGLLLLASRLTALAWAVTGFTLGHSLTLGLAVFDVVRAQAAAVETVIALSIVLVAAEAVWVRGRRTLAFPAALAGAFVLLALLTPPGLPATVLLGLGLFVMCYLVAVQRARNAQPLRWAVTFAFGLFHGFGFASVLSALELPRGDTAMALLGFNLGVELAQLAIVILAWPLLRAMEQRVPLVAPALASAIAAVGSYALVSRAFG